MRDSRVALGLLFVALVATSTLLIYIQRSQRKQQPITSRSDGPVFLDPSFTKDGYINPLEQPTEDKPFSSRAYVRGKVQGWESGRVVVQVGANQSTIMLEQNIQLRCFDEFIVNPKGERLRAADVWLDVSQLKDPGLSVPSSVLGSKFVQGADIVLIARVDDRNQMVAYQVIGYGCEEGV